MTLHSAMEEKIRAAARKDNFYFSSCLRTLDEQRQDDGRFAGRGKRGDWYYTLFAQELFPQPVEGLAQTLLSLSLEDLDFVHLCCVVRLLARHGLTTRFGQALCCLEAFRCADGFFHHAGKRERSSVYGCYLAQGALQQLSRDLGPELQNHLGQFSCPDHSFRNEKQAPVSSVPVSAAALLLLQDPDARAATASWLSKCQRDGWSVHGAIPVCDLLSTGTALFALSQAGFGFDRDASAHFVESCRVDNGKQAGFRAHALDGRIDAEYCFYGFLATACLSPE